MPRETPSPIDLHEPPLPADGLGWTATIIAVVTLLLLAINAVSLRDWAQELEPGPVQARVADIAESWLDLTDHLGLARPRAWLHDRWKAAEAARFGGEAANS